MASKPSPSKVDLNKVVQEFRMVPFNEIVAVPEKYCHRDKSAFTPESLESLGQSIAAEGIQVPLEVVQNHDILELLRGNRRHAALQMQITKKQPGFTPEMLVPVIEVSNLTDEDKLVRSILDNEVREKLSPKERLAAAELMEQLGVPETRAALALNVGLQTYQRDIRVIRYPRVKKHVTADNIGHTYASMLLEAAEGAGRIEEFQDDLDEWVALKRKEIRDAERRHKAQTGKSLKAHQLEPKTYLRRPQVDLWKQLLQEKKRFHETTTRAFKVVVKRDRIDIGVHLKPEEATAKEMALLTAQLSAATKSLLPLIDECSKRANQAPTPLDLSTLDLELLRTSGHTELAKQLEDESNLTIANEDTAVADEPLEAEPDDEAEEADEPMAVEANVPAQPATSKVTPSTTPAQPEPKSKPVLPKAR